MYRTKFKLRLEPILKIVLLLLPAHGFCQQESGRKPENWSYNYVEKAAQIPVVREALLDSIGKKLDLLQQEGKSLPAHLYGALGTDPRLLKENLRKLGQPGGAALLSKLPAFYSLKQSMPSLSQPFSLDFRRAGVQSIYDNGPLTSNTLISRAGLDFTASIAGVPFTYNFNWQQPSFIAQDFSTLYKISFDRQAMMKNMRESLAKQYDLQKLLMKDFNFQQVFRQYAETRLAAFRQSVQESFAGSLRSFTALQDLSPEEFLYLGRTQLEEKLTGKAGLDSLVAVKESLSAVIASNSSAPDSLKRQLGLVNEQIAAIGQVKEKLHALKKEFETEGLNYNQLVRYQQAVNGKLDEITGSESFISDASKKLLKLNGISRLFLYARELNIGQFSSGWSGRSLSQVLTSGIGGSFLKKNNFVGLNLSGIKQLGWIKDRDFINNLFEPSSSIQALRLGKGDLASDHSHISMVNATVKNTGQGPNVFAVLPRNIFVGSFSKKLSMGSIGDVEAEVSKSASQYRNTGVTGAGDAMESKMALRYFGADLLQTLSVGLQYQGDFQSIDFRPSFFINYAGLGYSNPASTLQSRGAFSYGFQFFKNFLGGKLAVQSRFSQRNTRTTTIDDRTLNQAQNSLGIRYRLSRKLKAGVSWTYSGLSRKEGESKTSLYYSNRISGDMNFMGKLAGRPLFQYLGLGFQDLSIPDLPPSAFGKMIWVSSASNLALAKGTLSANFQLYDQLQQEAGGLLTADAGWSYNAFKTFRFTTSLNYLNQSLMARQVGVRQTISATLHDRINLNVFADLRKDIKTNQNKFLYPNTRGEIEVTYKFN